MWQRWQRCVSLELRFVINLMQFVYVIIKAVKPITLRVFSPELDKLFLLRQTSPF